MRTLWLPSCDGYYDISQIVFIREMREFIFHLLETTWTSDWSKSFRDVNVPPKQTGSKMSSARFEAVVDGLFLFKNKFNKPYCVF